MSSLAQRMLDNCFIPKVYINERINGESITSYVLQRLKKPKTIDKKYLNLHAERFSFDDCDPTQIVRNIQKSGAVPAKAMIASFKMPSKIIWMEWKDHAEGESIGYLVEDFDGDLFVTTCVGLDDAAAAVSFVSFSILENNKVDGFPIWIIDIPDLKSPDAREDLKRTIWDIVGVLFLLTTPKVCEVRDHIPSIKLQKSRERRGKSPLLEIRKVKVKIGIGQPRYRHSEPGEGTGLTGIHHRLHKVIGHFRTYEKNEKREETRISWVPEHWRGDASLGVVLHERDVAND